MNQALRRLAYQWLLPIPAHLRRNQLDPDAQGLAAVEQAIRSHHHQGWRSAKHYSAQQYQADLHEHLRGRLEINRRLIVPWLDNTCRLRGQTILEIGCGTGSSTVALAEQGAKVVGVDIDEDALAVARQRAGAYVVDAEFRRLNAKDLWKTFGKDNFDSIIFFASLEHMTLAERLVALRDAWKMLPVGGFLVIIETPNRLWFFDNHTARLPFFHWLPDRLAFRYSRFSPRQNFRELYRDCTAEAFEHFLRRGRGMSFHELELAMNKPARELTVASSLSAFLGMRYWLRQSRRERRYKQVIRSCYPELHHGFFDDQLYLIIEKR